MPKPLQTLAFIGVSQPHDGDTSIDSRDTATAARDAAPRHDGHGQGRHSHGHDMTARRDRHDGYDG